MRIMDIWLVYSANKGGNTVLSVVVGFSSTGEITVYTGRIMVVLAIS